jgi:hypothetical protein
MLIQPKNAERLVRLVVWIGGVAATFVGAWVASKFRIYHDNRKAHLDDLKQRVLTPLRDGLEKHFRPLVLNSAPVVFVKTSTTRFDEKAKATQEPLEQKDLLLLISPGAALLDELDPALLEDATKRHFAAQLEQVNKFVRDWDTYARTCHSWVMRIAGEISTASGLPEFPVRYTGGATFRPYVMHLQLAVFVYKRLFHQRAPALHLEPMEPHWTLNGEGYTVALGSRQQIDFLTAQIDKLLEAEKETAKTLRSRAAELQKGFQELFPKLNYAIAARKLRKRCDMVPFF